MLLSRPFTIRLRIHFMSLSLFCVCISTSFATMMVIFYLFLRWSYWKTIDFNPFLVFDSQNPIHRWIPDDHCFRSQLKTLRNYTDSFHVRSHAGQEFWLQFIFISVILPLLFIFHKFFYEYNLGLSFMNSQSIVVIKIKDRGTELAQSPYSMASILFCRTPCLYK